MDGKQIIINADDVGMTPGATAAAEELFRLQKITSCSIAANAPDLKSVIGRILDAGGQMGIHLNLTEGQPVSQPKRIPSLLDSRGLFPGLGEFLSRVATGRLRRKELEIEVRAQFEKFAGEGGSAAHLDGHHHIHLVPAVAAATVENAELAGIKLFRSSPAGIAPKESDYAKNFMFLIFRQIFSGRGEKIYFNRGFSDRGYAIQISTSIINHECDLYSTLKSMPEKRIELVAHPEWELTKNPEIKGKYTDTRRQEFIFLKGLDMPFFSTPVKND